tara:strand:+ start:6129 stop:6671 length:543 start_codon:yes stop_codon:yes gene_type:complete
MYQLLPVLFFFISYRYTYDAMLATKVLVAGTLVAALAQKLHYGKIPKSELITLYAVMLFGGITIMLNDPVYIQWKPTITFLIFSVITTINRQMDRPPITQSLIGEKIHVDRAIWRNCDYSIIIFSLLMAIANTFVVMYLSYDLWVTFKFSTIFISMIASILLTLYLMQNANSIKVTIEED